jgi:hypothetical protein
VFLADHFGLLKERKLFEFGLQLQVNIFAFSGVVILGKFLQLLFSLQESHHAVEVVVAT